MTALVLGDPRTRALEIVRRHGHDSVSFQGLEHGFAYWFDPADPDTVVAYVDTGGAWVAAGGPICPLARLAEAAAGFVAAARAASRRGSFFGAERPLVDAGLAGLVIGEQPVWEAARWLEVLSRAASLRYQLRRATNKHVRIRRVLPIELLAGGTSEVAAELARISLAWRSRQRMPPMAFLVQLDPLAFARERITFVAERASPTGAPELVGFASVIPVYARARWFIEDLVRTPDAPNGTVELMIDAVMGAAAEAGLPEVTLGLAPLSGPVAGWLRLARWAGSPLYDFSGLRAFKAKLRPHGWEPVYLCTAPGSSTMLALRDGLRAFAGGSLLAFAARTVVGLGRRRR